MTNPYSDGAGYATSRRNPYRRPEPTPEEALKAKIARRERLLAEAEEQLAALQRRPKDTFREYAVVRFVKPGRFGGSRTRELTYAAIKAGSDERKACWFLTGMEQYGKTWEQLLDFIGDDNLDTLQLMSLPQFVNRGEGGGPF